MKKFLRNFQTKSVRDGKSTGIGIREEDEQGETVQIYSLYYDRQLSRRDIAIEVLKIIHMNVIDEHGCGRHKARLETSGESFKKAWFMSYRSIRIAGCKYTPRHEEAMQLADDAVKRRSTIREKL